MEKVRSSFPTPDIGQKGRNPTSDRQRDRLVLLFRVFYNPSKVVEDNEGNAWIRLGDECQILSDDDKRELAYQKGQGQFEQETATGYRYPDDFDLFLIHNSLTRFAPTEKLLAT